MIEKALKETMQKVVDANRDTIAAAVRAVIREVIAEELRNLGLSKKTLEYAATWLTREIEKRMDAENSATPDAAETSATPEPGSPEGTSVE